MKKKILLMGASALMVSAFGATTTFAQDETVTEDQIVVTGTRRKARSAADTVAPVDVITSTALASHGATEMTDVIRLAVPSYNVNRQPINDASTLIRPANLRGLSPDNTLVMVNSKRMHRAAVITFLGGGISDGAQGPDISVIPSLALKRVEVLRDGSSTQYGSDAIAGVMNFILKDGTDGGTFVSKFGSNYDNGGDEYSFAANYGVALGDRGFFNITGEVSHASPNQQSVQRDDAKALIAAGNTGVTNAVNLINTDFVQIWGKPRVKKAYKTYVNAGIDFSDHGQLYAFGNYARRTVEGGFFFRNPTNRGGVFRGPTVDPLTGAFDPNGVPSVRVGDLTGDTAGDCPAGIPLTSGGGLIPDPTILGQVNGDPNCFSFLELFPGGFTPTFGGVLKDQSIAVGIKGDIQVGSGLGYDISYRYGRNEVDFFIRNTINASLGPNTPTSFRPGSYTQQENLIDADFTYAVPIPGLASDLNLASGFEFHREDFTIGAGDPASFAIGPLSAPSVGFPNGQGFSSSSNGFGGFTSASAGRRGQSSVGYYLESEVDVTSQLTLQAAIRYENFTKFASTTDEKFGALFKLNDNISFRGTYSTGFHVPTAGQANVVNISTVFVGTQLADRGTIPLTSAAGQFMADFIVSNGGKRPTLAPESSDSISFGTALKLGPASLTIDYFHIKLKNRISTSSPQDFIGALKTVATQNNVAFNSGDSTSQLLNALDAAGVLRAADFAGSEDLTEFQFFTNDFDTRTQGLDFVGHLPIDLGRGNTDITAAANYTKTTVTKTGGLQAGRLKQLQRNVPRWRGNVTFNHDEGRWAVMARANYYGKIFEDHLDSNLAFPIYAGSEIIFDTSATVRFLDEKVSLTVGADNVFNNFPDKNPFAGVVGAKYPLTAPGGFDGGFYYARLSVKLP